MILCCLTLLFPPTLSIFPGLPSAGALSDFLAHSFCSWLLLHSSLRSCFTPFYFQLFTHSLVQLLPALLTAYYSLSLPLALLLWHSLIHLVSSPLLSLLSLLLCTRPCSLVGVSFYEILPGTFFHQFSFSIRFSISFPLALSFPMLYPDSLSRVYFPESFFLESFSLLPFSSFNLEQQLMI